MLFIDICEYFDSTSMYILSLDRSAEQEIRQLLFLAPIEVMILGESNIFSMILTCSVCQKTAREKGGLLEGWNALCFIFLPVTCKLSECDLVL